MFSLCLFFASLIGLFLTFSRSLRHNSIDFGMPLLNNTTVWRLNSPPKPHAFVSLPLQSTYLARLWKAIASKKFIYTSVYIFITGFLLRHLIWVYFGVNVFTDLYSSISIFFYLFIAVHTAFIREAIALWLQGNTTAIGLDVLAMNTQGVPGSSGGNATTDNGGGNATTGNGGSNATTSGVMDVADHLGNGTNPNMGPNASMRAGKLGSLGGFMYIENPEGVPIKYNKDVSNQPLATNFANTLERQMSLNLKQLTKYNSTPEQRLFLDEFRNTAEGRGITKGSLTKELIYQLRRAK